MFRVSCIQLRSNNNIHFNLNKTSKLIKKAVSQKANLIITPEVSSKFSLNKKKLLEVATTMNNDSYLLGIKKLAKNYLDKNFLKLKVQMQPNITVMIAIKNQKNLPISSIKFNDDILAWAANENSKKRFKSNINLWTLQATLKWSKKTINRYKNTFIVLIVKLFCTFEKVSKKQHTIVNRGMYIGLINRL